MLAALRTRGACFRPELAPLTGRLPAEVDEGLWDLVARGLVTADAFSAVRSLLSARDRWRTRTVRRPSNRLSRRRAPAGSGIGEGRWSLLPGPEALGVPAVADGILSPGNEELAEVVAHQLLVRWGVVTWELWGRESFKVPWREVVWALRRLEARGLALGGRFVAGLSGEQYALPEAAEDLLAVHRRPADGEEVVVAGADPLNLTGSILGGTRVPTRRHQRVVYRDGDGGGPPPRRGEAVSPSRTIDLNADVGEATDPAGVEAERGLLGLVTTRPRGVRRPRGQRGDHDGDGRGRARHTACGSGRTPRTPTPRASAAGPWTSTATSCGALAERAAARPRGRVRVGGHRDRVGQGARRALRRRWPRVAPSIWCCATSWRRNARPTTTLVLPSGCPAMAAALRDGAPALEEGFCDRAYRRRRRPGRPVRRRAPCWATPRRRPARR